MIVKTLRVSRYTAAVPVGQYRFALMNSASGAVDIVNSRVVELISSWETTGVNASAVTEDLITQLRRRGYLTEKSREEELRAARRRCESLKRWRDYPKQHHLVPTYNCNLRCSYCYERHLRTRGEEWLEETLDPEQIDQIFFAIDRFDEGAPCPAKSLVVLYGGEPLLWRNREIVEYILQTGAERGHSFAIVTNGFRLREFAPLLSKYPIDYVHVTLDGPPEVHNARRFTASGEGTFDRIIQGMNEARQHELAIQIRIPLDVATAEHVPELAERLNQLGLGKEVGIRPYVHLVFGNPEWDASLDRLLDLYMVESQMESIEDEKRPAYRNLKSVFRKGSRLAPRFWHCGAHTSDLFYDPFGDIYTCWRGIGSREFAVGRYSPELVLNEDYDVWMSRTVLDLSKCSECKYALLCGGGCAFRAYKEAGTIQAGHCKSLSFLTKALIPHLYEKDFRAKC
jgi:uncharacterized protein